MKYLIKNLAVSVHDERPFEQLIYDELGIATHRVYIERQAIDARRKSAIRYVYHLIFESEPNNPALKKLLRSGKITEYRLKPELFVEPVIHLDAQPLIVGFGPAGMFAALELARKGYRPIVFERGPMVRQRLEAIEDLWSKGTLDPEANMQFGEGGAGTFSDGKLTTGKAHPLDHRILETFVEFGAPPETLYRNKPHIGTDKLRQVVVNLRQEIERLGGQVLFGQRLEGIETTSGALRAIVVNGTRYEATSLILAIGHSARDTVRMLRQAGVVMEPKPYALGTRIEHPAELIDRAQFGADADVLPAADYKLTYHSELGSAFSFCMCPGGQVVCASSEPEGQVSNGMSYHQRDGAYSNAALVVGIDPQVLGHDADAAVEAQRDLERLFYRAGGGGYVAPAQRAVDFGSRASRDLPVATYRPGIASARLDQLLPERIAAVLQGALAQWDRAIPGFAREGLLIGLESRTSSPLRIPRDETCCAESLSGLYVLGEGAGYAGGIMTCARDACRFVQLVHPLEGDAS